MTASNRGSKEIKLPTWQIQLISAMYQSIQNNYIFSEKISDSQFKQSLSQVFNNINQVFHNAGIDIDKAPTLSAQYKVYVDEINKVLATFDPHLILQYDPDQIADHKKHERIIDDPRNNHGAKFVLEGLDAPKAVYKKFEKENYGFVEKPVSKSIPEDIGYIKIVDFLDPRDGLGRLAAAKALDILKNLQGKKAIVIDLRDSHGGSPEMVKLMLSYFLSEADKAKIKNGVYNTIFDFSTGSSKEYKVQPTEFNLAVPLYILTNENTFSAAEEFAYDLQQINKHALKDDRIVIVGQTTKGGSHPMTGFPLMDPVSNEVNANCFLWIPTKSASNPYTLTNWEDGPKQAGIKPGVQPDPGFEIPKQQDALETIITRLTSNMIQFSSTAQIAVASNIPAAELKPKGDPKNVVETLKNVTSARSSESSVEVEKQRVASSPFSKRS